MKNLLKLMMVFALTTFTFAQEEEPAIPERGGEGTVTIELDPPGSEVYIDGDLIGKAPIKNLKFRSGRFDLIVIDQEQELVNARFNVWANKENIFNGKTVMPFGNINVSLVGARRCGLTIDGEDAGNVEKEAPVLVKNLDAGDHMIRCGRLELLLNLPGETTIDVVVNAKKRKILINSTEAVK